jgi:ubiquinone/menaquinone biosynthesis C-methylase UbiE
MDSPPDPASVIRRGSQLLDEGQIDSARALWQRDRNQPEILGHLAWLERTCGHRSRALKHYLDLLAKTPDNPEIPFRIGEIWRDRGDWTEAAAWFARAKDYPPAEKAFRKARRRALALGTVRHIGEALIHSGCGRRFRRWYRRGAIRFCSKALALNEWWRGEGEQTLRLSRYLAFLWGLSAAEKWRGVEYHKTREIQLVCKQFSRQPGGRILDIGTGENPFALFLAARGFDMVCVDGDRQGLHNLFGLADERGRPAFVQADVRALPFRDSSFDAATAICVLEHIPGTGDQEAMRETRRVIREGGIALVTVEAADGTRERWEEVPYRVGVEYGDRHEGWIEAFCRDYAPETVRARLVDPNRWTVLDCGFFDERIPVLPLRGWCDARNHPIAARCLSPWQAILSTLFYRQTHPKNRRLSPSAIGYLVLEKKPDPPAR